MMPIFVDRHDLSGMTAEDVAEAHRKDLEVQDRYGVRFITYWFDQTRESGFCLIDAPDKESAIRVHQEAHGNAPSEMIQADLSAVEAFLGRIADRPASGGGGAGAVDPAFRAVMFTDIVGSTEMTARLGDARAVEMVRAHDAIVRRALTDAGGREVKHTGDGIMASLPDPVSGAACARAVQQGFAAFNRDSAEPLEVRVGVHAGEPVEDSNDLFGATVQMAARLCAAAEPGTILVSDAVRTSLGAGEIRPLGSRILKGFAEPVPVYDLPWARPVG